MSGAIIRFSFKPRLADPAQLRRASNQPARHVWEDCKNWKSRQLPSKPAFGLSLRREPKVSGGWGYEGTWVHSRLSDLSDTVVQVQVRISRPWQPAFSCLSVAYLRCVASHSFHGLSLARLICICICEYEYLCVLRYLRSAVSEVEEEAEQRSWIKTKEFCGLLLLLLL